MKNVAQATQVAAGKEHTCARLSTGAAVCWGGNADGELGDATLTSRSLATPVYGLKGTAQVSAGGSHTCAQLANSTLTCWGSDFFGQLGNGGILVGFSATPVDVIGSGRHSRRPTWIHRPARAVRPSGLVRPLHVRAPARPGLHPADALRAAAPPTGHPARPARPRPVLTAQPNAPRSRISVDPG